MTQMAVAASQPLAWLAASHLGFLPNGSPEKMMKKITQFVFVFTVAHAQTV